MLKHPLDFDLIVFDLDGTLRQCKLHKGPCHNGPGQWELIPGVHATLARYNWQQVKTGCATNQAGVALGFVAEDVVCEEIIKTCTEAYGGPLPGDAMLLYCPHHPQAGCACRKPAPGMLSRHTNKHGIEPPRSLYVGDKDVDEQAARAAGWNFMWSLTFFGGGV